MKKNTFMEGAIIATVGIVIAKVIGLLYVIPFNAIIGEKGGALYGYAYNVYQLFLSISSAGFPFAISKLTSEYIALGYKRAVKDTYKFAMQIIFIISIIMFILLFVFAPSIGRLIIGNATGGNTYSDIAFVIRMVSFAILVIPFLSVTKGFLQGNKYIAPTAISQLIEQIIRVAIILLGSYIALKVFNTDLKTGVGIAVSGAFFGGVFAYLYLKIKINKAKILPKNIGKDEKLITKKEIISKILKYSIPFIVIGLIYNLYITTDMILVSRSLNDILKVPVSEVESVVGVFTTWGNKLNNIILALVTGLITSLIPNIVSSYTKCDMKDVDSKFNTAIQCVLLLIVPATIFLSLLSNSAWTLFYGNSVKGPIVYKLYVYQALFGGLYTIMVNTLQGLNKYKLVIISVFVGLMTNVVLDVPFILLFNSWGLEPSHGAIVASLLGFSIAFIIPIIVLYKKYNFNFSDTIKRIPNYIISWIIFVGTILLIKLFVPVNLTGRFIQIPVLLIYGIVSFGIYLLINYYNGNLKSLFELKGGKKK